MQAVKIQSIDNTFFPRIFLGDKKLEEVRKITFNQSVDTIPCFTFETVGFPSIEIKNAKIYFEFTPETISDAVKVIRHSFSTDKELYDTLVSNIASALKELPRESDLEDVAKAIADRIIERKEE